MMIRIFFFLLISCVAGWAAELSLAAGGTVTGFEMNRGDTVRFRLRNGAVRVLVLEGSSARVLVSNLKTPRVPQRDGGTVYEIRARVRVDGHRVELVRYVGVQESFAVPYVINGMRIWLDAVRDSLALLRDDHGGKAGCSMAKDVRFAANDVGDAVAPVELRPWFPLRRPYFDIAECYNGDDPYFGAYQGAECHAGLDLNMPMGTPLYAPVDLADHYLFNSLRAGDNNNRWRGIHRWPDGSVWTLQAHHIAALLPEEHRAIRAGEHYADAAGVLVGSNEHSHFVFKVRGAGEREDVMLDPWILFWQMFEQERRRADEVAAVMGPLGPSRTGEAVRFSSEGSRQGRWGRRLETWWTFGDGGFSMDAAPRHVFARAGVYPVTLTVWNGVERASVTQLVTVDGAVVTGPVLALAADDETGFVERGAAARDSYGVMDAVEPHTVRMVARVRGAAPRVREVMAVNVGGGGLGRVDSAVEGRVSWLAARMEGERLRLEANPAGMTQGFYRATVAVRCAGCANSPQAVRVVLEVREARTGREVVVDDGDAGFYRSPEGWVTPRLRLWREKGWQGGYRVSTGKGFVRFTPDLRAGRYAVSLVEETPFADGTVLAVKVRGQTGVETRRVEVGPGRSRVIGEFAFGEGMDGYVEIAGEGAGVMADAVRFRRVE